MMAWNHINKKDDEREVIKARRRDEKLTALFVMI
jgi:hypothetical protein